ncbi:MAG TPA: hypothetical protein VHM28_02285 [Anaerolineales bacterium]|nr:hypothetical protein [Anaerolineales bacterium]
MKRILTFSFVLFMLAACGTPNQVPIPVTQGPTPAPEMPAPAGINAPVVSSPALVSIRMIDAQNGWGINDNDVLRTDDGGATWHNLSPQNVSGLGYAARSEFLDAMHGWVIVPDNSNPFIGTLYITNDGGVTWKPAATPFGDGDLHFLDTKNGWLMASLGAGAGSMGVAVYQSTDGGATWNQTYTNDPNQQGAGDSLPLGGLKNGITPFDMQTAWIGGVTYAPGVVYLYQTKDGGHTWNLIPMQIPDGYDQAEFETIGPQFVSPKDAYLPVHISSQNGVMLATYVSHDAGQSWTLTPTMIPQGGTLDFVDAQNGFAWNGTSFYVTHDGAQTWTSVSPDVAFGDSFAGLDFVDASTGFVLTNDVTGTRVLYKTTDGGATWNVMGQ